MNANDLAATILIPTHDHGPTLEHSVGSVLAQTVTDLEIFVIGDGAPDETRVLVERFAKTDRRVRWFGHPKGPRHGEIYRHEALAAARGRIVCYLADDDLYFPDHVEVMAGLLENADFAHTLPIRVEPDGSLGGWAVDLERPVYRRLLASHLNRIPFGHAGHTRDLYRRLPFGWRTTPRGIPTDVYMWDQILGVPGIRARSGRRMTALHFPSLVRKNLAKEERAAELGAWRQRIADPAERPSLERELLDYLVRDRNRLDERITAWGRTLPGRISNRLRKMISS